MVVVVIAVDIVVVVMVVVAVLAVVVGAGLSKPDLALGSKSCSRAPNSVLLGGRVLL